MTPRFSDPKGSPHLEEELIGGDYIDLLFQSPQEYARIIGEKEDKQQLRCKISSRT
jgi:hypothetical protein